MKDYKEIFKLRQMLVIEGIPFDFNNSIFLSDGYQIVIYKNGEMICDAVQHAWSYGNDKDLIEISGGLTEEELKSDTVLGYLTAEEVFKRFKYCYDNNTYIYKEEEKKKEKMKETTITVNLENLTNDERDKLISLVQKSNEKCEKCVPYKPKTNEQYWFVDASGDVSADIFLDYPSDQARFILGNCFKTKEEAELYIEELLVIAELKHIAHKLNNGWKPNWKDRKEIKWYICYDAYMNRIICGCVYESVFVNNVLFFKSKELCEKAINFVGEERLKKYYFKIQ